MQPTDGDPQPLKIPQYVRPPWTWGDLWLGVGLVLVGYVAVIGAAFWLASIGDPDVDRPVAIALGIVTLAFELWLGTLVLILADRRGLSLPDLGLRVPDTRAAVWGVTAVVGAYSILIGYGLLILAIQAVTGADLGRLLEGNGIPETDSSSTLYWIILGLSVAVAAPVGEELFFRAFLFRGLQYLRGFWFAIVASGLVFALVHFEISVVLPFWLIGAWFAWIYARSRSLWSTVLAHAVFNGVSFALTYIELR